MEIDATYSPNSAYPNNPFIEAMPSFLLPDVLIKELYYIPKLPENVSDLDAAERLACTNKIYEAFVPLDFSVQLYNLIYQGILSSYSKKNTVDIIRQTLSFRNSITKGEIPETNAFMSQAISYSVLGIPGVGKTSTITRILNLFPQVIRHTEYKGQSFYCHQITYICIQCPADCSIKAACIQVIDEINRLLFAGAPESCYKKDNITTDALVAIIAQLCLTHHIGALVIDEIQNVVGARKGSQKGQLINFFVQLTNETGICVIFVGTPEISKIFDSGKHIFRRTRGPRLTVITDMTAFHTLASELWKLQVTQRRLPYSDETGVLLYRITEGVPALLSELLVLSQQEAILSGEECLSSRIIKRTAQANNFNDRAAAMLSGNLDIVKELTDLGEAPAMPDVVLKRGRPKKERADTDLIVAYELSGDILCFLKQKGMEHH